MLDHAGNIILNNKERRHTLLSNCRLSFHHNLPMCIPSLVSGKVSTAQPAQQWKVSLDAVARTIEAATQNGVRSILHDTLHRRFRTNDRQLQYRCLHCDMFNDTLEAAEPSWHRKNRYAQVFATTYCWVRVFPMQKKSNTHEGLSLLAACDGVPATIVMDNAREQTMGNFRWKAREMGCDIKQMEPYSPWQAETAIRELSMVQVGR